MEKVMLLCAAFFFIWMSVFHGTDAQSRIMELCLDNGEAENGTSFPAELGGSVDITFCVNFPKYNYPLHNFVMLKRPGSSPENWETPKQDKTGPSQWLITLNISRVQHRDFMEEFIAKVYYEVNSKIYFKDFLVFTFSLYEASQEGRTDASDYSDEREDFDEDNGDDDDDDDNDDKGSLVPCTDTDANDGICDSGWKYAQEKCIGLFNKEKFKQALTICEDNGGTIVGDFEPLKQCFGGVIPDDVQAIWTGGRSGTKCQVLKPNNDFRKIGCVKNERFFVCGKDPNTEVPTTKPQTPTTPATPPTTTPTTTTTTTPTTTTTTTTTTTSTTTTTMTTRTSKPQCPDQTNTKCPNGWTATGQGKCLKFVSTRVEYGHIAQKDCENMGASLLDGIGDDSMKACIVELIPPSTNYILISDCRDQYIRTGIIKSFKGRYPNTCSQSYPTPYICAVDENQWAPATVSAFQLSQGDPLKNVNEITNTDLIKTNLLSIRIEEKNNYLTFSCNATSSPRPQVSIKHNEKEMNQSRDGYVTYVLEHATCNDSGSYSCQAKNEFGESELVSPPIQVLCPVKITSFTIYDSKTGPGNFLQTYQSHPVSFSCMAEGNPAPNTIRIQNERNDTLSSTFFQNSVSYNIKDVRCPNMGGYYCKVETQRNGELQERVELAVSSCPVQLCNPSDSSTTISPPIGGTVSIPLCLISYEYHTRSPRLAEKDNEPIYNKRKYFLKATKLSDSEIYWNATLEIQNIEERDVGTMVFGINNYNGKSPLTYTVHLKPEGPPSCPSHINVTNKGASCITLSWQPGFDGGADQSFHVYHSVDNVTWTQTDVRSSANTYTLSGLTASTLYAIRVVATNRFTDPSNINEELCNSTVYDKTDQLTPKSIQKPQSKSGATSSFSSSDTTIIAVAAVIGFIIVVVVGALLVRYKDKIFPVRGELNTTKEQIVADDTQENVYANVGSAAAAHSNGTQQAQQAEATGGESSATGDGAANEDSGRYVTEEGLVYVTIAHANETKKKESKKKKTKQAQAKTEGKDRVEYVSLDFDKTGKFVVKEEGEGGGEGESSADKEEGAEKQEVEKLEKAEGEKGDKK